MTLFQKAGGNIVIVKPHLAELTMPFLHNALEVAPFDQVLRSYDWFWSPTTLQTRQQGDRSATLRSVLLRKELFILEPLLDIRENTEQEPTCPSVVSMITKRFAHDHVP